MNKQIYYTKSIIKKVGINKINLIQIAYKLVLETKRYITVYDK